MPALTSALALLLALGSLAVAPKAVTSPGDPGLKQGLSASQRSGEEDDEDDEDDDEDEEDCWSPARA